MICYEENMVLVNSCSGHCLFVL